MSNALRILVVTPSYKPAYVYGGPTRSITELCEALSRQNAHVTVLTTTANGSTELNVEDGRAYHVDGVTVIYYKRWTGDHSHFSPSLLYNVWRQCTKYDVIHIQSWWNLVSVLSACICILRGTRPVISLRGTLSPHSFSHNHTIAKRLFHNILGGPILKRSILHVTSLKEEIEVSLVVPDSKSVRLPNLLSLPDQVLSNETAQRDYLHLLFVGRIHPIKNLEVLFDTLHHMNGTFRYKLSIVGDGEPGYVTSLKAKASSLSHIEWLGEIDGGPKYALMARADLLVLLSHSENFGNVVVESLSQGTPVLVSKYVGASEYIHEHNLGWTVEPNIQECTNALRGIVRSRALRDKIRRDAPKCIAQNFGPEFIIPKYLALYKSLCGQKGAKNQFIDLEARK